jgi:hypothetical protein
MPPVALGLGEGELEKRAGQRRFRPAHGILQDGLPADAWTTLEAGHPGHGTCPNDRSFNGEELRCLLNSGRNVQPTEWIFPVRPVASRFPPVRSGTSMDALV